MRLFARRKEPGWLVLLPRPGRLMLAHVRPNGQRSQVVYCEEREFDESDAKSIERIAREFHADRYHCTSLLPPDQYQMFVVEAPSVRADAASQCTVSPLSRRPSVET